MSKIRIHLRSHPFDEVVRIDDRQLIHKAKHVLRLKAGDTVYLFDGKGREYQYIFEKATSAYLLLKKIQLTRQEDLRSNRIVLAFPLVKEDKIDFILQKATELGVDEFIPFICARSITALPSQAKYVRWQKIITEASRQAQRLWIPSLHEVILFKDLLRQAYAVKFVASLAGECLSTIPAFTPQDIIIAIGPEGDFSQEEYQLLKQNNFNFIILSGNILRVETASIFAVGLLHYWLSRDKISRPQGGGRG